jgi:hypothetical protein
LSGAKPETELKKPYTKSMAETYNINLSVDEFIAREVIATASPHAFGASWVARKIGLDVAEARAQLNLMVERGILERHFVLLSPFTGRSLKSFKTKEDIPFGKVYDPEEPGEEFFIITERDVDVLFRVATQLHTDT